MTKNKITKHLITKFEHWSNLTWRHTTLDLGKTYPFFMDFFPQNVPSRASDDLQCTGQCGECPLHARRRAAIKCNQDLSYAIRTDSDLINPLILVYGKDTHITSFDDVTFPAANGIRRNNSSKAVWMILLGIWTVALWYSCISTGCGKGLHTEYIMT